jgi:DNA-binding XRE family transcriptional regulator
MDNRGYSKRVIDANKKASLDSLGVRLGRLCINEDISVAEVAEVLGVSRMTIYKWFTGHFTPKKTFEGKILAFLSDNKSK